MRSSVVALILPFIVDARFWPGRRVDTQGQQLRSSAYTGASDAEIALVSTYQGALDAYARRPDCFKDSAALINARCEELDSREDERVRAAISMTLCELATAKHYTPPLECAPFVPGTDGLTSDGAAGECVNALSRSAQYWSSYSGYLREIPQLCFAYRRWHDIDTAKEIYRNATLRELDVLKTMDVRGAQQAQALAQLNGQLEGMRTALSDLDTLAEGLQQLPQIWERQMGQSFRLAT
ncbi:uncharacterized protein SCHCODRAFT_085873 [Schizophyllum commune H4-8]|uniref:Secreted protein n=1 Tax=Schizophyllum commune (strain H4-8 / FGSC 9210) TaxID=578458 RepID=D8QDX1_SCHCM|nr:uncharacterized protein SCHCODRAFT_085873 [Schizophyllum commune H4-8]KAI5888546.1 hypothetical protein SCHCODRAFT_085873 [Schizophyllum commune H4-8]